MIGVVNLVTRDEKGNVHIPYERVIYENIIFDKPRQKTIEYIFDDGSSVTVIYTMDKDYIINRECAKNKSYYTL